MQYIITDNGTKYYQGAVLVYHGSNYIVESIEECDLDQDQHDGEYTMLDDLQVGQSSYLIIS